MGGGGAGGVTFNIRIFEKIAKLISTSLHTHNLNKTNDGSLVDMRL